MLTVPVAASASGISSAVLTTSSGSTVTASGVVGAVVSVTESAYSAVKSVSSNPVLESKSSSS